MREPANSKWDLFRENCLEIWYYTLPIFHTRHERGCKICVRLSHDEAARYGCATYAWGSRYGRVTYARGSRIKYAYTMRLQDMREALIRSHRICVRLSLDVCGLSHMCRLPQAILVILRPSKASTMMGLDELRARPSSSPHDFIWPRSLQAASGFVLLY